MECWTCRSNTGEKRISPGPTIFEGKHWLVEHAYPVKLSGWLVIVLKRHAEALHELTVEEFTEPGQIQAGLVPILYEELHCEKEYVVCYAEMEHFRHRDPSPRWKEIVEPAPGRFTHHLELWTAGDMDNEVRDWLQEAWTEAA